MKRKFIIHYISAILIIVILIFLTSCFPSRNVKEIRMKDDGVIEMAVGEFSYEGKKVILVSQDGSLTEVDLKEEMIPEIERLNFYKFGEHEVKVYYTSKIFTTMKIRVNRKSFDDIFALEGYSCVYDGLPHRVELNNKLPDGASIDYLYGNSFTEAGEYDIVAVMSKDGYNPKTLTAKLIIQKAEYDKSSIKFDNLVTTYDGNPKMISIDGLPNGVKVTYEIYNEKGAKKESAIDAGTYKIVARFSDTNRNYEKLEDMEATLVINKARYDMSRVSFKNSTKEYDGQNYIPNLDFGSVLPEGVSVNYKFYNENGELVESNANAGTYKIVAEFSGDSTNYEAIPSMEATLTVEKKLVVISNKVSLENVTVNYDREVHSLKLEGEDLLPEGVNYTFKNNNQIIANEYKVTVSFTIDDINSRLDIEEITAYLIINKIEENVLVFDETTQSLKEISNQYLYFEDDNGTRTLKIRGLDLEKYRIGRISFYESGSSNLVSINELEYGKQYDFTITFNYVDSNENKSVTLSPLSGVITYTNI